MKNTFIAFVVLALIVAIGWGLGANYQIFNRSTFQGVSKPAVPIAAPATVQSVTLSPHSVLSSGEWQRYREARQKTLDSKPELAAEYKELLIEMDAQQKALNLAMIRIDPKIEPAISKLDLMRKNNSVWE